MAYTSFTLTGGSSAAAVAAAVEEEEELPVEGTFVSWRHRLALLQGRVREAGRALTPAEALTFSIELEALVDELEQRETEVTRREDRLKVEKAEMEAAHGERLPEVLTVNVGGQLFTTSRDTLCRFEGTRLDAMFGGRWRMPKDVHGNPFIDRDPEHFSLILNILRDPESPIEVTAEARDRFVRDLDYFHLTEHVYGRPFGESEALTRDNRLQLFHLFDGTEHAGEQWELLFRATRDGFSAARFHEICDDAGDTVVVIRTSLGCIFGGFYDGTWSIKRATNLAKSRSFLFIFETLRGSVQHKLRVNIDPSGSPLVSQDRAFGPLFGVYVPTNATDGTYQNAISAMHRIDPRVGFATLGTPGCPYESPSDWVDCRFITGTGTGQFDIADMEVFCVAGAQKKKRLAAVAAAAAAAGAGGGGSGGGSGASGGGAGGVGGNRSGSGGLRDGGRTTGSGTGSGFGTGTGSGRNASGGAGSYERGQSGDGVRGSERAGEEAVLRDLLRPGSRLTVMPVPPSEAPTTVLRAAALQRAGVLSSRDGSNASGRRRVVGAAEEDEGEGEEAEEGGVGGAGEEDEDAGEEADEDAEQEDDVAEEDVDGDEAEDEEEETRALQASLAAGLIGRGGVPARHAPEGVAEEYLIDDLVARMSLGFRR